jgi:hypothetical protein
MLLSIISAVTILFSLPLLKLNFSYEGWNNLFDIMSIPIKFSAAAFVVLAVWLTIQRVFQMDFQLRLIDDHNRFNNYFRHMEEFTKYISKDPLVSAFLQLSTADPSLVLLPFYKQYYSSDYRDFRTTVNPETKQQFTRLFDGISNSPLNNLQTNLSTVPHSVIDALIPLTTDMMNIITSRLYQEVSPKIQGYLKTANMTMAQITNELATYEKVAHLYWSAALARSVLSFDGEVDASTDHFTKNYWEYADNLGL